MTAKQRERVAALVKALRSGNYKQTRHRLRSVGDGYCCLGVACDLAKGPLGLEWNNPLSGFYRFDGENSTLPVKVKEWYGFDFIDPFLRGANGERTSCVSANDTDHLNFNQIADALERTYLNEFDDATA